MLFTLWIPVVCSSYTFRQNISHLFKGRVLAEDTHLHHWAEYLAPRSAASAFRLTVTSLPRPRTMSGYLLYIYVAVEPVLAIFQKQKGISSRNSESFLSPTPPPKLKAVSNLPVAVPAKKKEILSLLGTSIMSLFWTHTLNQMFSFTSNKLKRMIEVFLMIALPPSLFANGDQCWGGNLSSATKFCQVFLRTFWWKGSPTPRRDFRFSIALLLTKLSMLQDPAELKNGVCRDEYVYMNLWM